MTYRIKVTKDAPGIGTIKSFIIEKYQNSLLGGTKAEVTFSYSNGRIVEINGDEKEVFHTSIDRIKLKRNKVEAEKTIQEFIKVFSQTTVGARSRRQQKGSLGEYYNPFSIGKPSNLLNAALVKRDLSTKELANQMARDNEQKETTTYTHTTGSRAISREVAIKYANILKCDPVDLMFNKLTIPVWGKVNLMEPVPADKVYAPGEIYTYYHDVADAEISLVPRDLWRSDIKAIKVDAKGTMFHNQTAFYYYKKNNDEAALNKLCVVGRIINPHPEIDRDYQETEYYFGVYENIRGKSNLINPDPFVDDMEQKFILKNFKPTFVAPVVAMVNTDSLVDDTDKQGSVPQSEYRKEERMRMHLTNLKDKLKKQEIENDEFHKQADKIHEEISRLHVEMQKKVAEEIEDKIMKDNLKVKKIYGERDILKLIKN